MAASRTTDQRSLIVTYLVIAFGLAWLVASPLWFGEGLDTPGAPLYLLAMMTTPAIAALSVVFLIEKPERRAASLGLAPLPPTRRFLAWVGIALVLPIVLVVVALLVGVALGLYVPDLRSFSGFDALLQEQLAAAGETDPLPPLQVLVLIQCIAIIPGALINTIPALGEELGWRGFLLPRLLPLGPARAIIISGVVWGLWHAPVILLGYNYPGVPWWLGLGMMVGFCTIFGAILAWIRIRSTSVWPAAVAHGSINAAAGLGVLLSSAAHPVDAVSATILGWSGWLVPIALIAVIAWRGGFTPRASTDEVVEAAA